MCLLICSERLIPKVAVLSGQNTFIIWRRNVEYGEAGAVSNMKPEHFLKKLVCVSLNLHNSITPVQQKLPWGVAIGLLKAFGFSAAQRYSCKVVSLMSHWNSDYIHKGPNEAAWKYWKQTGLLVLQRSYMWLLCMTNVFMLEAAAAAAAVKVVAIVRLNETDNCSF